MPFKNRLSVASAAVLLCGNMLGAAASRPQKPRTDSEQPKTVHPELKAVYLVAGKGELDPAELKAHPEVAVVHTWADFKTGVGQQRVALWIDKNAVSLVKAGDADIWLRQEPQKWRPIVLVGYNDALYSFRESLPYFGISGPAVDWSRQKVGSGFSLWKMQEDTPSSRGATVSSFNVKPGVKTILRLTTEWLSAHKSPGEK